MTGLRDEVDALLTRWAVVHLLDMRDQGWPAVDAQVAAREAAHQLTDAAVDAAVAEFTEFLT